MNALTAEQAWNYFSLTLRKQIKLHIPMSVPKNDKRRNIWMTREATTMHKRKQEVWKHHEHTGYHMDYIRATSLKNEFTTLTRNLCRDFERKLASNMKDNSKDLWKYCKSKLKNKSRLGDMLKEDGNLTSEDQEKAELLNKYFKSVFTREDECDGRMRSTFDE